MNWSQGTLLLPHGHSAHGLLTQASLPLPARTLHRMRLTLMDTWRGSVVRWLGTGRSLLCGFPPSGSVWSWPGEPPGSPCPILASNERAVASRFESFTWHEIWELFLLHSICDGAPSLWFGGQTLARDLRLKLLMVFRFYEFNTPQHSPL